MWGRKYTVGGILTLLAALFVLLQGVSAAHEVHHGPEPHSHEGVLCSFSILQEKQEDECLTPPDEAYIFIPKVYYDGVLPAEKSAAFSSIQARAPPPRAPPHYG